MSETPPLGRLELVPLRSVWAGEASHFTPWLAEEANLSLLGDTIGMDLELEAQEKNVGPFRADILCKDLETENWVLIENQLERTDHNHLGQLLTYAAGLKAVTIVWIADRFTEEHRAALDWLNEITDDRFNFFGLEVELWRIGESMAAPKFNVASKPNDWTKRVVQGAARVEQEGLTEGRKLQLEFWSDFRDFALQKGSVVRPRKPSPRHWMSFSIGRSGFRLSAVASYVDLGVDAGEPHMLRAELYLSDENAKSHFALLHEERQKYDEEFGEPLHWDDLPEKQACRVSIARPANLDDRARWGEYHAWLLTKLETFHRVFGPVVKRLDASEYEPPAE